MDSQLLLVLSIFLVAGFHRGETTSCFVCNSGSQYNGTACADHFSKDPAFIVNCDAAQTHMSGNYTNVCRKLIQDVEGDHRIIRTCATKGGSGCYSRTGTQSIKLMYCECEGNLCNNAKTFYTTILTIIVSALLAHLST